MLIDWFTVLAQVLNFLVLVWLLKRFLYRPILNAIDAREKRIALALADAEARKAEAVNELDEFKHKNDAFDQQREELLNKATDEARAESRRLLNEARDAAVALRIQRQEALRDEEDDLHQAISRRTQQEVFAIARKALADLAETSLEERMVDVFVHKLAGLKSGDKGLLVSALKATSGPVVVRTTFDLPPAQRTATEGAVKETLGMETQVRFETTPDLISGIELTTDGQKVAWSIADYLASLEQGVAELLQEKEKPEGKAQTQAPED